MTPRLSARGLTLFRGDSNICRDLSLQLQPGECVQLLGANGSGKTTLMQALCGLLSPETGTIAWHEGSARTAAHYCAHLDGVKTAWTVAENLSWQLRLHGCTAAPSLWQQCLNEMQLGHLTDTLAAQLSQGERRRTALARLGLMPRPVWLLDEPFNALDTAGRQCLVNWINRHTDNGGAVLFSNHGERPAALKLTRTISLGLPS